MPTILRRLPAELREQCFVPALEWQGKTPALIVALRGEPDLYQEVIEIFEKNKNNEFILGERNNWSFRCSDKAKAAIRRVKIQLRLAYYDTNTHLIVMSPRPTHLASALQRAPNVEELHFVPLRGSVTFTQLNFDSINYALDPTRSKLIHNFPHFLVLGLARLKKISFTNPGAIATFHQVVHIRFLEEMWEDMILKGNAMLGANAKLTEVKTHIGFYDSAATCFWQAEEGKFLCIDAALEPKPCLPPWLV